MDDTSCLFSTSATRSSKQHHELQNDIETLMQQRAHHRKHSQWQAADAIKALLLKEPYGVEIIDYAEKPSVYIPLKKKTLERRWLEWSEVEIKSDNSSNNILLGSSHDACPPFVVATVDTPKYKERLFETKCHIRMVRKQQEEQCCCRRHGREHFSSDFFSMFEECHLLDINNHPSIGVRRIVFEGWRTILLPKLLHKWPMVSHHHSNEKISTPLHDGEMQKVPCSRTPPFVWVAEDDVRVPFICNGGLCPHEMFNECMNVFDSNPEIDILSLGHAWKDISKHQQKSNNYYTMNEEKNKSSLLLNHLKKGGGVHGSTLLAIRFPTGVQRLLEALESCATTKRQQITHFDQFLFHSTLHDLGFAFSDPPLVGWAEVDHTLTTSGMGHRRKGGGRYSFQPPPAMSKMVMVSTDDEESKSYRKRGAVCWVKRKRMTQRVDKS